MATQIDRLISLTHLPNVRLGVIPTTGHMPIVPMDTFTIYDDALATVETTAGIAVFRDPRDVAVYAELLNALEGYALFGERARECLSGWATEYRSQDL
jgi:hypothetical protein